MNQPTCRYTNSIDPANRVMASAARSCGCWRSRPAAPTRWGCASTGLLVASAPTAPPGLAASPGLSSAQPTILAVRPLGLPSTRGSGIGGRHLRGRLPCQEVVEGGGWDGREPVADGGDVDGHVGGVHHDRGLGLPGERRRGRPCQHRHRAQHRQWDVPGPPGPATSTLWPRSDRSWMARSTATATSSAATKLTGLRPGPKTRAWPLPASLAPVTPIQVSRYALGRMIVHRRPLARSACSAANLARYSDIG